NEQTSAVSEIAGACRKIHAAFIVRKPGPACRGCARETWRCHPERSEAEPNEVEGPLLSQDHNLAAWHSDKFEIACGQRGPSTPRCARRSGSHPKIMRAHE